MRSIIEALQAVGYPVPENCYSVSLDSEHRPTRITFDCMLHPGSTAATARRYRHQLTDRELPLVLAAVQLHKVSHRLRHSK